MSTSLFRVALAAGIVLTTPTAMAQSSGPSVASLRSDLASFRSEFLGRDNSYTAAQRAVAVARVERLESRLERVTPAFFELELARIVALADNGHTNSPGARRSPRYNRVPLRLVPFGTDFHVLRAGTAHADLLGARLAAIDGRPVADVRSVAHALWGGTPAFRDRQVPFFLESPEQMHALGVTRAGDGATYRFVLPGGRTVERRIAADPPDPARERQGAERWLSPEPLASDGGTWRHLLATTQVPWSLREVNLPFRWRVVPELDAVVVQLRTNRDAPGRPIRAFLDSVTAGIRRANPRHVILDMRANGGGDLNTTRDFMQALPVLVPGRLFALTSPWTFSAAISSIGYLKQAAGPRLTIVGEMVGDRLEFWAEGGPVYLQATGAAMTIATERHDYRTGCTPYRDCHGSVVRHPISVSSLAPGIEAPLTIDAYVAGRDPGMEAIAAALRAAR
jgi:hypothetical protein